MMDRLYPYPTLSAPLETSVSNVLVEDLEPRVQVVRTDSRAIDLSSIPLAGSWHRVQFHFEVAGPSTEIREFDDVGASLSLTTVISSGPTNMRQTFPLTRSAIDPARWSGTIGIDRRNFSTKATLKAILAGAVAGIEDRFLGESHPWNIYFEEPAIPPIEGTLRVKWVDFRSPEAPPAVQHYSNEIFYAEFLEDPPIIYLNSGFPGLFGLLKDARSRPPAEQALHDSVRMGIASSVWTALLNTAIAGIQGGEENPDGDDEQPDWPSTDWQVSVLRGLLPRIFEGLSPTEALRHALDARDSADAAAALESRAQLVIGSRLKVAAALRRGLTRLAEEVPE
jgi:hypothetical protein